MQDFTIQKYVSLLDIFKENNIPVYRVKDWIQQKPVKGIFLRHDVDRKPVNSLLMANIESQYDIRSTYYFRIGRFSFNKKIIKQIHKMGHEVGYHYEDFSLSGGKLKSAKILFKKHLQSFRQVVPVDTISAHGRPFSKCNNQDLFQENELQIYQLEGDAIINIDYSNVYYFTDTGRNWHISKSNLRDNPVHCLSNEAIITTDDLIQFILKNKEKTIAITVHPERWARNQYDYLVQLLFDKIVNMIKYFLVKIR